MEPRASDDPLPVAETPLCGARWAVSLAAALLVAMALFTSVRWFGKPSAAAEEIVQVPVPVVAPTPPPRPEDLAPDPGDTP